ncbi:MAG: hypothetical protein M3066_16945 [Actinomycetota bacterium]|nr:hypothetical protein [Actinomycetota bacterium]
MRALAPKSALDSTEGDTDVDEPVEPARRKRPTYKKAGHKEVTTRMPEALAKAVRDAAAKQGMSVNSYMIALASEAVGDARVVSPPDMRAHVRRTLQTAFQTALDRLDDEELPVSA